MSSELGRRLRRLTRETPNCAEWRPAHFDLAVDSDRTALAALLDSGTVRRVHDTLAEQLGLLLSARSPAARWTTHELDQRIHLHLADRKLGDYGVWVWYPWSATLVHVLPKAEYREVRTDRNRHQITRAEQGRLAELRIGVVGLSVGNAAAVMCALEGIGGAFRIADPDRLDLSNLNRLRAGTADLGVEKTALAARQMFEVDPYLGIERFADGVQPENVDDFLLAGGRLDLVVEECDDLHLKVLIRERARAHRIPVIMETSDRGLLDIERFDLEPGRPVFHGLVDSLRAADVRGLATKDKIPFVLAILDGRRLSTRAAASLPEIGQTIGSWPQLASGVALGGALVADAARRLLLGGPVGSGRYYVDPATLVADGAGEHHEPAVAPSPGPAADPMADPPLPPEPAMPGEVTEDAVRWIAALGTLAPSAHNAQPWTLTWRRAEARLECRHDPARDLPSLDFEHGATWVAFGALIENIELAAGHLGLRADTRLWPNGDDAGLVCTVAFTPEPQPAAPSPLVGRIISRVTNRRREQRRPLGEPAAERLGAACAEAGGRLQLVCADGALAEVGELMGAADRLSLLNRAMHHDVMQGYRWTPEEARATPYGLDLATAELTSAERAVFSLLRQWRVMECLAEIGGGGALADLARSAVAGASAVGLLTMPGTSRESYLRGGRAMQRMWLTAAADGIAVHPITTLPYLFARLERGAGVGLDPAERAALRGLRVRYRTLFETPAGHAEVLLFRLARAGAPSARSLRRPLGDVLRLA